jgi:hypothetical protein
MEEGSSHVDVLTSLIQSLYRTISNTLYIMYHTIMFNTFSQCTRIENDGMAIVHCHYL